MNSCAGYDGPRLIGHDAVDSPAAYGLRKYRAEREQGCPYQNSKVYESHKLFSFVSLKIFLELAPMHEARPVA
jgi:hypothetical protein